MPRIAKLRIMEKEARRLRISNSHALRSVRRQIKQIEVKVTSGG